MNLELMLKKTSVISKGQVYVRVSSPSGYKFKDPRACLEYCILCILKLEKERKTKRRKKEEREIKKEEGEKR